VSQRIIEVEGKSLDDSTSGERRQANLPTAARGPAVLEEDVPGCNLTLDNHLSGASRGLYHREGECTMRGEGTQLVGLF
jgi:hypothetical protein